MKKFRLHHRWTGESVNLQIMAGCGVVSWLLYFVLLQLSSDFSWETLPTDRPVLEVLVLFAILVAVYLFASSRAVYVQRSPHALPLVVMFSVAFRVLMLFSEPILEIDAYRYVWDGKVTAAGVNPFRYSPKQVLEADKSIVLSAEMVRLLDVRDQSAANAAILSRVHYPELTTVYPPVSQIVFASVALVTSSEFSVATQILIMKSVIMIFDLMTFALVITMLRFIGKSMAFAVLYGWCPLMIKEFSNSGHLDSIAVFLTTSAMFCALKAFFPHQSMQTQEAIVHTDEGESGRGNRRWLWLCSVCVAAAVGAKIYPVVVFPLLFFGVWRAFGVSRALCIAVVTLLLCVGMIAPMLNRHPDTRPEVEESVNSEHIDTDELLRLPDEPRTPTGELQEQRPTRIGLDTGLAAFAGHWQMNDFLFMVLYENLRPDASNVLHTTPIPSNGSVRNELPPRPGVEEPSGDVIRVADHPNDARPVPWFVVTPNAWRNRLVDVVSGSTYLPDKSVPFALTRVITGGTFLVIAVWLAVCAASQNDAEGWLEAGFLTIAWFWLLQPTQNPWYWTWAMPLLPFARSRVWLAVSGVVFIYYFRFWLLAQYRDTLVPGTRWHGAEFFDYCVTWVEFAPLLVCLMIVYWRGRRSSVQRKARNCSPVHE